MIKEPLMYAWNVSEVHTVTQSDILLSFSHHMFGPESSYQVVVSSFASPQVVFV